MKVSQSKIRCIRDTFISIINEIGQIAKNLKRLSKRILDNMLKEFNIERIQNLK